MPVILENAWSTEGKWLPVKRILFKSQIGNVSTLVVLYTSSNPLNYDTTVDPGAGLIRWNDATPSLVTQLAISDTDRDGGSQTTTIADLKIGDEIIVRQDTGRYYEFILAAEVVTMAGWFQLDVTFSFAVGLIQNNKALDITFNYFPEALPAGGDKLEIRVAAEWPWIIYRIFDPLSIVPKDRGLIPMDSVELIEML